MSATTSTIATFNHQPQEVGLNAQGLLDLQTLRNHAPEKILETNLNEARKRLVEIAAALNERAYQRKHDFAERSRRQVTGVDDGEQPREEDFQQKVTVLTKELDHAVRRTIESKIWHDSLPYAVQHITTKSREVARAPPDRRRRQRNGSQEQDDAAEEDQSRGDALVQPDESQTPSSLLQEFFIKQQHSRRGQSLTDRYSRNNDYIEFYNSLHCAKHDPENQPPVPSHDFWFAEEEGRAVHRRQDHDMQSGDEQDSELEVRAERISTRCPLTLRNFTNPWRSTNCSHSFEKDAIVQLIRASENLKLTPEQRAEVSALRDSRDRKRREKALGIPQAGCPVCNMLMTEADLVPNPGLLRRIQRILEKDRREAEAAENEDSSDEDDGLPRGTQRKPARLGSESPTEHRSSNRIVKKERASVRRGTELSTGATPASQRSSNVDLTNELAEDEEMTDA